MSEQLSWPRLKTLLRNESIGEYRSWLIASAVVAGALLLGAVATVSGGEPNDLYYRICFLGTLSVWGTIQSSFAFSELHDKSKNTAYLLLPASSLEKTLAPLLITTVVLIAYLLVFTALASVVIEVINRLAFGRTNEIFNPLDRAVWIGVPNYLVAQSLFFLGAAWFRKAHYLKTLLAILVGSFLLGAVSLVASMVAGMTRFTATGMHVDADIGFNWLLLANSSFTAAIQVLFGVLWFIALPAFCWFVAWLRVSETQVSHGV
jgi:hypothetical protein